MVRADGGLSDDGWHLLKVNHTGTRIQASIDGQMRLMVNAGDYIPQTGGMGLWTKADAATAFDSFTVFPKCFDFA
jgi:hypothetical protein